MNCDEVDAVATTSAGRMALITKLMNDLSEMYQRHRLAEVNYDFYLGYLKHQRPCVILPRLTGICSQPLLNRKQQSACKLGRYELTCIDSDDDAPKEHDYCNPQPFIGFTPEEQKDSIQRYFLVRDADFHIAGELPDLEELETKESEPIQIDIAGSDLIRAFDSETHFGYLLDPNFRSDTDSGENSGANANINKSVQNEEDERCLFTPCSDRSDSEVESFSGTDDSCSGNSDSSFPTSKSRDKFSDFSSRHLINSKDWESDSGTSENESEVSSGCSNIDEDLDSDLGKVYGAVDGIFVRDSWVLVTSLSQAGCHVPLNYAVHPGPQGAYSLLLTHPNEAKDYGDSIVYYGLSANTTILGRKRKGRKRPMKRRKLHGMRSGDAALYRSLLTGKPIRLVRSSTFQSVYSPAKGFQYGGLFYVCCIQHSGTSNQSKEYRFVLISEPNSYQSRGVPMLWEVDGKLPSTTALINFGHPRDAIMKKEANELKGKFTPRKKENEELIRCITQSENTSRFELETRFLRSGTQITTASSSKKETEKLSKMPQKTSRIKLGGGNKLSINVRRKSNSATVQEFMKESELVEQFVGTDERHSKKRSKKQTTAVLPANVVPLRKGHFETAELEGRIPYVKLTKLQNPIPEVSSNFPSIGSLSSAQTESGRKALWIEKVRSWNINTDSDKSLLNDTEQMGS